MLELRLKDILQDLGEVLSQSSQGLARKYEDKYVIKLRDEPEQVPRELKMMSAAGDLSVAVVAPVGPPTSLDGFMMPLLSPIDTSNVTIQKKLDVYRQMRSAVQTLLGGVIHGDVKICCST